jgi:D-sedoheptulose 7-phosphate isomerase
MKKNNSLQLAIENSNTCKLSLLKIQKNIKIAIKAIYSSLANRGKVILCGNGGSAADAQHLAAELLIRLNSEVDRKSLPAIALGLDTSTLTACGNDYSFDKIFARPFSALANKKDILIVISTSGNSRNIIEVLKLARKKKIKTIGFLGLGGGKAKKLCNITLMVNSKNTATIQEAHIFLGHYILGQVEKLVIGR